ncbi:GNAT family N-acetyltransferase [Alkaliphilus peptidifermentans]|uniref:Ribosomal-protein-alanine N-acetyltransferase n=1 Tax=Alkaliphilus peptidifermentans DSM 18978 TaxID=1120976 RepID=A0A1G5E613_9FIRM|nr:GNAT family N-acetyltransferase [Alkaliphilus peptidifermentans]SCY22150.1 ribosomal-protein-alanine N-acetyltransferase [Alkaliphilus peptidifermentans DSM 18978]
MFYNNIETDRLLLKNIDSGDSEFIFSQFSDVDINKYLFDAEPLTDISEADGVIEFYLKPEPRPQHRWIVIRKADGVKMGTCGFHCWSIEDSKVEIGYDLKKEFWGNGYMYEALKGIIEFAEYSMELKEINACIYTENHKSISLAEKLGFVLTGSKYEIFRGEKYLHSIYSLNFK